MELFTFQSSIKIGFVIDPIATSFLYSALGYLKSLRPCELTIVCEEKADYWYGSAPRIHCWSKSEKHPEKLLSVLDAQGFDVILIGIKNWLVDQELEGFVEKRDGRIFLHNTPVIEVESVREIQMIFALTKSPKEYFPELCVDKLSNASVDDEPRILMLHREDAETHPGGDTTSMYQLARELRKRGLHVDIDLHARLNPKDYDLVHLFNFSAPEIVETQAQRALDAGVPYVVSTMYEDWPRFLNQRAALAFAFDDYIRRGQPRENWANFESLAKRVESSEVCDNTFSARNAALLIASGKSEAFVLKRDYPSAKRIEVCHWGAEVSCRVADPKLFQERFGVKDFILCVGRIEDRKNQLMVLKALDDLDIPIVLAGGGVSSQPHYEAACRKFVRLKGETYFLPRLSPELLASAYAASRVHVCPSWYELPGLVSLEAAYHGANVVATNYGTISDYLEEDIWYCEPGNNESVRSKILTAFETPFTEKAKNRAAHFTWERCGEEYQRLYHSVFQEKEEISKRQSLAEKIEIEVVHRDLPVVKEPESISVLVQMRANAYTQPGGDTRAMEKTTEALRKLGVRVDIDVDCRRDPKDYNLVHLYNFSTPEALQILASRAIQAGVPYVVTSLFEDWARFFMQMQVYTGVLGRYLDVLQNPGFWPILLDTIQQIVTSKTPVVNRGNRYVVSNAAALIASGEEERDLLTRSFRSSVPKYISHFGTDFSGEVAPAQIENFRKKYKLQEEFILCVGRIELRKNQLTLMKALEDVEHTLVLASTGFSYQPEYEQMVRRFRRKGRTEILPRLEDFELQAAYASARVHVLPSWYELPGLVTLEAAVSGCAIAASDFGTIRSYLGDQAHYFNPGDFDAMHRAVLEAWRTGSSSSTKERARSFTWDRCAREVLNVYQQVLQHAKLPKLHSADENKRQFVAPSFFTRSTRA